MVTAFEVSEIVDEDTGLVTVIFDSDDEDSDAVHLAAGEWIDAHRPRRSWQIAELHHEDGSYALVFEEWGSGLS